MEYQTCVVISFDLYSIQLIIHPHSITGVMVPFSSKFNAIRWVFITILVMLMIHWYSCFKIECCFIHTWCLNSVWFSVSYITLRIYLFLFVFGPFDCCSVLDANPWRETSKPVYVLTQRENQLCTMKTRRNRRFNIFPCTLAFTQVLLVSQA